MPTKSKRDSKELPNAVIASKGLKSAEAEELLLQYGRNELEDKQKPKVRHTYSKNHYFISINQG